ncbi:Transposase family Tnp2 protein [Rhizoctonia solani]|uniref:Transposase family Tnp2 protein n=1 Tax=Rhizoctonia solani TaxID=456999 RepID=A0A8H8P986_9AGAM|nr:Transposase family Tnp2 protein [Rhizoctonia solani]QRW26662.1 Transposase family Tnp2 protein [Rhizoctonia solani]
MPRKYYNHVLALREIILLCLQFKITRIEVNKLQAMINNWVLKYKMYYYQYRTSRLPTCPLTIHALLHIPYYILQTGPLWASWAFVMERFCGRLLPAVRNRTRPYIQLDNYIKQRAQLQLVAKKYDIPTLTKAYVKPSHPNEVQMSTQEIAYPQLLGRPIHYKVTLDKVLKKQLIGYFNLVYPGRKPQDHVNSIDAGSLIRYGQFCIDDGDRFRTAIMVDWDPTARDNSYIKAGTISSTSLTSILRFYHTIQYGRLHDIYYVEYIEPGDGKREPYLLARVTECVTGGIDASRRGTPLVTYNQELDPSIIHLKTIVAVIGRVHLGGKEWAIVDRSRDGARTQFLDVDGNVDHDVDDRS